MLGAVVVSHQPRVIRLVELAARISKRERSDRFCAEITDRSHIEARVKSAAEESAHHLVALQPAGYRLAKGGTELLCPVITALGRKAESENLLNSGLAVLVDQRATGRQPADALEEGLWRQDVAEVQILWQRPHVQFAIPELSRQQTSDLRREGQSRLQGRVVQMADAARPV